ncbi:MAG: hypothetical protein OEN01_10845 [Candidatus Krumholzibacteria bacterium]|nr:hypothetical protein [Candidatus Krumholzibacteria bacterium]
MLLTLFAVSVYGCGAGYRISTVNGAEKVYRIDEEGNRTLVYERAKDGTLTVHDESDPKAQQAMAAVERQEQMELAEVERIERIKRAAKRTAGDPIFVALHETALGEKLQASEKPRGAVFGQIRKEFEGDDVISLVSAGDLKKNEYAQLGRMLSGTSPNQAPAADVVVVSKGYLKEVVGIDKKTGKPGSMVAVVFEATITSNFLPAEYKVEESGNIFRNVEVTTRFADKIKSVIKDKIGPTLPADRSL